MAKKTDKTTQGIDALRPYVERALKEPEFRENLREALEAARGLYGDLSKKNGGVMSSAERLVTDKHSQERLQKALASVTVAAGVAAGRKSKKRSRKGRKMLLTAGVVAGALYNPWTGESTRQWIMDKIAGDDDLQPLDDLESFADDTTEVVADAPADAGEAVEDAAT
jgi:hypothetical protein